LYVEVDRENLMVNGNGRRVRKMGWETAMTDRIMRGGAAAALAVIRTRILVPAVLAGLVLFYEFMWKATLVMRGPNLENGVGDRDD